MNPQWFKDPKPPVPSNELSERVAEDQANAEWKGQVEDACRHSFPGGVWSYHSRDKVILKLDELRDVAFTIFPAHHAPVVNDPMFRLMRSDGTLLAYMLVAPEFQSLVIGLAKPSA